MGQSLFWREEIGGEGKNKVGILQNLFQLWSIEFHIPTYVGMIRSILVISNLFRSPIGLASCTIQIFFSISLQE